MTQPSLLDWKPPEGNRDGSTFDAARDGVRLNAQMQAVWDVVKSGDWYTLKTISIFTKCPEASVSARLRDLRKVRWGGLTVERKYVSNGLWAYRVVR